LATSMPGAASHHPLQSHSTALPFSSAVFLLGSRVTCCTAGCWQPETFYTGHP
jgi:hypothetical protein